MTRRSTFLALLASPLAFVKGLWVKPLSNDDVRIISALQNGTVIRNAPLPSGADILKSFDARDWARAFVEHARQLPTLATDEETMTSWFANSLMRGYDERSRIVNTDERERCIRIVENSVSAQPDHMNMPSSYDAIELTDGTFESIRSQNLGLRKRWAIQRLTAKSVIALIRCQAGPSNLDEHDDLALLELGYVPGIGTPL